MNTEENILAIIRKSIPQHIPTEIKNIIERLCAENPDWQKLHSLVNESSSLNGNWKLPVRLNNDYPSDQLTLLELALYRLAPVAIIELMLEKSIGTYRKRAYQQDEQPRQVSLHFVCLFNSDLDVWKLFIQRGFSQESDIAGKTPLHWACQNKNLTVEMIKLLIEDKNNEYLELVESIAGYAPLHSYLSACAKYKKSPNAEIFWVLVGESKVLQGKTEASATVLHLLSKCRQVAFSLVNDVLHKVPNLINSKNYEKYTPLEIAWLKKNMSAAVALLFHGADCSTIACLNDGGFKKERSKLYDLIIAVHETPTKLAEALYITGFLPTLLDQGILPVLQQRGFLPRLLELGILPLLCQKSCKVTCDITTLYAYLPKQDQKRIFFFVTMISILNKSLGKKTDFAISLLLRFPIPIRNIIALESLSQWSTSKSPLLGL